MNRPISEIQSIAFESVINSVSDAVALICDDGEILFQNPHFEQLPEQFKKMLSRHLKSGQHLAQPQFDLMGYRLTWSQVYQAVAIVVDMSFSERSMSVYTLKSLNTLLNESDDIYYSAAKAIQKSLGWRWVAITRFAQNDKIEVLSYLDDFSALETFEYDLVGTPCEVVVDTNQFTVFDDVKAAFPNYKALLDLGVKTYAGLVFKGPNGEPIGHVMAMHDKANVNFARAKEVIDTATLALSSHFQLHTANVKLKQVTQQANIDKLTSINNRSAFEKTLEKIATQFTKRAFDDWTIAIVDLDNLKPLNDNLGHKAGDQFIKLIAIELRQLGRQSDIAFRIGGDEFALIFSQNATPFIDSVLLRFNAALKRIQKVLNYQVGASIGFAALSETKGDVNQWVALADQRMYADKNTKKINIG